MQYKTFNLELKRQFVVEIISDNLNIYYFQILTV